MNTTLTKDTYKERQAFLWTLEDLGWHILPIHGIHEGQCECGRDCNSPGKHPKTRHGLKDATANPEQIAAWENQWRKGSFAVRTGPESGIVVIDVDKKNDGLQSWSQLLEDNPEVFTVTAISGGGGRHYYFEHPGVPIQNSRGRVGMGIDVRGDNGYILLPESTHLEGRYMWADGMSPADVELMPLPAWLQELMS